MLDLIIHLYINILVLARTHALVYNADMKHIVTLETAKKLKELGWKKETLFNWTRNVLDRKDNNAWFLTFKKEGWDFDHDLYDYYPAPIASELLEELPEGFALDKHEGKYRSLDPKKPLNTRTSDTPSQALALMYIYLKENKLI